MIPLIITSDFEYANDYNSFQQGEIIKKLCEDLKEINLPVTAFVTSEYAYRYPESVKLFSEYGNDIECHGFNHNREENYKKLKEKEIRQYISAATDNIEVLILKRPVCFRGPAMSTSSLTQRILIETGYIADFSVCSQRIDFFYSAGGDIRWLSAPRNIYNPSDNNPYKKGFLPIKVVPLRSIFLPFTSGTMYIFGLNFMKIFYNILIKESAKTKKPVVYIFHPYEFTEFESKHDKNNFKKKKSPVHNLYTSDIRKRYEMNFELFRYMLSFKEVQPLTGREYCLNYNKSQ